MTRTLPTLPDDQAAAEFVATADLTTYDLSAMTPVQFEFAAKDARGGSRAPGALPPKPRG